MNYGALSSIPRQTTIGGQPHMLAYINPEEESLIQDYRGNLPPVAGPDGVPAYLFGFSWGGGGGSSASSSSNDDDDDSPGVFSSIVNAVSSGVSSVVNAVSNTVSSAVDFVSDAGNAAANVVSDTVKEVVTLGAADTGTYNPDVMNMNYNATADGLNTAVTTGGVNLGTLGLSEAELEALRLLNLEKAAAGEPLVTALDAIANPDLIKTSTSTADAMKEYADSMKEAEILSLGGKQMPAEPDNVGNTPILTYTGTGSDGEASYEVFGGLDPNNPATMSYNEDGTLFVPYDGKDPYSIDANTNFYGSTDPNSPDYNMSLDLATTGSYVNLEGERVEGEPFETDFPMNGAAILNELGKDHLLKTGDDSKMIVPGEDGGYTFLNSDEKITSADAINIINVAIDDGLLDSDILEPLGPDGPDGPIIDPDGPQPYSTDIYGTRDIMGDFYGGRSGGMWDRFANSYLTRFGYSPEQFNEMVRKVENPDGTVNFFGADGQLINPESIGSNYRLSGDPTVLKIGEESVAIGSQDYDAAGNLISTNYTDAYNPDLDADILAQNQVYSVTDPASGQLVTFPNQAQYDQFVAANNAALSS